MCTPKRFRAHDGWHLADALRIRVRALILTVQQAVDRNRSIVHVFSTNVDNDVAKAEFDESKVDTALYRTIPNRACEVPDAVIDWVRQQEATSLFLYVKASLRAAIEAVNELRSYGFDDQYIAFACNRKMDAAEMEAVLKLQEDDIDGYIYLRTRNYSNGEAATAMSTKLLDEWFVHELDGTCRKLANVRWAKGSTIQSCILDALLAQHPEVVAMGTFDLVAGTGETFLDELVRARSALIVWS